MPGVLPLCGLAGKPLSEHFDAVILGPGGLLPFAAQETFAPECWEGVQLLGVGLGWAPNPNPQQEKTNQRASVALLRQCEWIWARDAVVGAMAQRAGIAHTVAPDIVYLMDVGRPTGTGSKTVAVCPNATMPAEAVAGAEWLCAWLQDLGYYPYLLPASAVPNEIDLLLCQKLRHVNARADLRVYNHLEFAQELGSACAVYSFRKHPFVMAELFGIGAWACDVSGGLGPLHEVAGGYGRVVGGLAAQGNVFAEWPVRPDRLRCECPRGWSATLGSVRTRVAEALGELCARLGE